METKSIGLYGIKRNRELIFIESMKELYHRINSNQKNPYNLVRKGAILRLLVIDGNRLFNVINKDYKLKFNRYLKVSTNQSHSLSTFENPNSTFVTFKYFVESEGDEISITKFLNLPAIKINNPQLKEYLDKNHVKEEYSIADIIKLIANAHGGVHFENWGDKISSYVATDPSSPFNLNVNSILHDIIDNISKVILNYLDPLGKSVFDHIRSTHPIAFEASTTVKVEKKEKEK